MPELPDHMLMTGSFAPLHAGSLHANDSASQSHVQRNATLCRPGLPCMANQLMHRACEMVSFRAVSMQDVPELQGAALLGTQLPTSASMGSLALPAGLNPEDIAEGSIRFFHDDLCLSIPFKGEHFMSIDAIKALTPRELILLYEASPSTISALPIVGMQSFCSVAPQTFERRAIEDPMHSQCCGTLFRADCSNRITTCMASIQQAHKSQL